MPLSRRCIRMVRALRPYAAEGQNYLPRGNPSRALEKHHLDLRAGREAAGVERDLEHAVSTNQREDQVGLAEDRYRVQTAVSSTFESHLHVVFAARRGSDVTAEPRADRSARRPHRASETPHRR